MTLKWDTQLFNEQKLILSQHNIARNDEKPFFYIKKNVLNESNTITLLLTNCTNESAFHYENNHNSE